MTAKIDILLPFWGDVVLLKQAVQSILEQSESAWRLIVIDDCYPSDEPRRYIESLNDSRILYVRHQKNIGITKNFNYAVSQASAQYCVIMGCDDIMHPNYIKRALEKMIGVDFYQPNVTVINKDSMVYLPLGDRVKRFMRLKPGVYSGEPLAISLSHGNWLYFPSICWKTSSLKKYRFDEQYKVVEDLMLEMQLIIDGGKLLVDDEITFSYRRFAGSVSSKEKRENGTRFTEESHAYSKLASEFARIGWRKASRAARLRITSRFHQFLSRLT